MDRRCLNLEGPGEPFGAGSLPASVLTKDHRTRFWRKVARYGFPVAAWFLHNIAINLATISAERAARHSARIPTAACE